MNYARCRSDQDRHLVKLIELLYKQNFIQIGEHYVETSAEVPQGGVISPLLFNIYLEEALQSLPTWNQAI